MKVTIWALKGFNWKFRHIQFTIICYSCQQRPFQFDLLHFSLDLQNKSLQKEYQKKGERLVRLKKRGETLVRVPLPKLQSSQRSKTIKVEQRKHSIPLLLDAPTVLALKIAEIFEFNPRKFFRGPLRGLGETIILQIDEFSQKVNGKRTERGKQPLTPDEMLLLYVASPKGFRHTQKKLKLGPFATQLDEEEVDDGEDSESDDEEKDKDEEEDEDEVEDEYTVEDDKEDEESDEEDLEVQSNDEDTDDEDIDDEETDDALQRDDNRTKKQANNLRNALGEITRV